MRGKLIASHTHLNTKSTHIVLSDHIHTTNLPISKSRRRRLSQPATSEMRLKTTLNLKQVACIQALIYRC